MNLSTRQLTPRVRCAIYTRKSTEEGLEQEFNSLDAQREAAESYIASQRHEGWSIMPQRYDDGGYSGGTMERPALERLIQDIEDRKIDCVVVYKVDRLSRSLLDFAKIIETFDRSGVSFVSVTQAFSTTTSMGRLTLNILLSFAQFEREIIGERIRDKIAAEKRKGKFTGGTPPLGYDVDGDKRRIIINKDEAKLVRHIFKRFVEIGSPIKLAHELNASGLTTKTWMTKHGELHKGKPWDKGHIYRTLHNRTYIGEVKHKDKTYPGEHEAIITHELWDRAQAQLELNAKNKANYIAASAPALLKGIIRCGSCDRAMSPVAATNHGRKYRYYNCGKASKSGIHACPIRSVPAGEIEEAVIFQLRMIFKSPEMIAQTFRTSKELEAEEIEQLRAEKLDLEALLRTKKERSASLMQTDPIDSAASEEIRRINGEFVDIQHRLQDVSTNILGLQSRDITEQDVADALRKLDPIWEELYPAEKMRIVQLLVERVIVNPEGMNIRIRTDGIHSLISELKDTMDGTVERMVNT